MEDLLARVDRDTEAYAAYLEARAGRGDLDAAVRASIAVPRETAELGLAALERLARDLSGARARLASEALTSAMSLLACVEGAAFTARSNLHGLADAAARERLARELGALTERARELARAVQDHVTRPANGPAR